MTSRPEPPPTQSGRPLSKGDIDVDPSSYVDPNGYRRRGQITRFAIRAGVYEDPTQRVLEQETAVSRD